ncbi:MAG: restriction endonuclease subunit S [Leptospiraceae bacterium]|nr:restriction endonuclease subunit S [Leptospiraceae bacterium]
MKWEMVKLGDLCTIVRGSSPRPKGDSRYYGGKIPRLMIEDITRDGMYVTPRVDSLTEEGAKLSRPMKKGDMVITVSGRTGVPAILNVDACIHDGFVGFRNLSNTIDKIFLYHYLESLTEITSQQAVGAIFKNLTTEQLSNLRIPLPPLSVQKEIAEILDTADALRKKDNELLKKYDELAQSIFIEMFGDPVRNEKGWEVKTIESVINKERPITYGILMPGPNIKPNGVPYIRVVDIKNNMILEDQVYYTTKDIAAAYKRSTLKENDILYSIRGHVGRSCIVKPSMAGANITQDTARLDFNDEIINEYALEYMKSDSFSRIVKPLVRGAAVKGLNLGDLKKLPIPIPDLKLQKKFRDKIALVNEQKSALSMLTGCSNNLFHSLLQKAFKGELT